MNPLVPIQIDDSHPAETITSDNFFYLFSFSCSPPSPLTAHSFFFILFPCFFINCFLQPRFLWYCTVSLCDAGQTTPQTKQILAWNLRLIIPPPTPRLSPISILVNFSCDNVTMGRGVSAGIMDNPPGCVPAEPPPNRCNAYCTEPPNTPEICAHQIVNFLLFQTRGGADCTGSRTPTTISLCARRTDSASEAAALVTTSPCNSIKIIFDTGLSKGFFQGGETKRQIQIKYF